MMSKINMVVIEYIWIYVDEIWLSVELTLWTSHKQVNLQKTNGYEAYSNINIGTFFFLCLYL